MKRKAYSRAERKAQILDCLYDRTYRLGKQWNTTAAIAKCMDLTPSPHLRAMCRELVDEGHLEMVITVHRSNVSKIEFSLPPDAKLQVTRKVDAPKIRINGKQV